MEFVEKDLCPIPFFSYSYNMTSIYDTIEPMTLHHKQQMSTNVYVLRCENGKRYVGKAADVQKRFQEHKNGNGSAWTNKYRPIRIEQIYKNVSPFEEDKITKETMGKYGIKNVRGGTYCSIQLSHAQKESLEKEIRGAQDCCFNCGEKTHFAKDCRNEDDEDEDEDDDEDDDEDEDEDEDEDDDDDEDDDEDDEDDEDDDEDSYYSD